MNDDSNTTSKQQTNMKRIFHAIKKNNNSCILKWAPLSILVLTALIYSHALYNGFMQNWDDEGYVLQNPDITSFSLKHLHAIFSTFYVGLYEPFTMLVYMIEYALFGLKPLPYHLLNVLLHLVNTFLVFKLAERLSGKKITAIVVSLLFALHPMHVESVAWITELKDVQYALFYLSSMLVYLRYIENGYKSKHLIGSLLLFAASLLSKPAAVTLPVLLIAIDIYKGRKINKRLFFEKVPFLILSLLFGFITLFSQKETISLNLNLSYNFIDKIFLLTYSISLYFVKLIAPFNLSAMYYYPDKYAGALPWQYYASLAFVLILVWLVLRRNSYRKELIFGACFFLITISVMLQVIAVGSSLISERYTYIPYIGLFYITGQLMSGINKKKLKSIAVVLFSLFVIMFSYLTRERISLWKDSLTLFNDVIKKYPENYFGYYQRGCAEKSRNEMQGAIEDFSKSIQLNQNNPGAYNERGGIYFVKGNMELALIDYNSAILVNPKFIQAYCERSSLKIKIGDITGALKDINTAIEYDPSNSDFYWTRRFIKANQKDYKQAIEDYDYSLKLYPENYKVYLFRGNARYVMKDTTGGCEDWNKALSLGLGQAAPLIQAHCH